MAESDQLPPSTCNQLQKTTLQLTADRMFGSKKPTALIPFYLAMAMVVAVASQASAQSGTRGSVPSFAPSPSYSPPSVSSAIPQASYPRTSPVEQRPQIISPQYASPQLSGPSQSMAIPYAATHQLYSPWRQSSPYPATYWAQPSYQGFIYPSYRPTCGGSCSVPCR